MKKIFTLFLFAAGLTLTASAQNRNDRYNSNDRYQVSQPVQNRNYGGQQQSNNYAYNDSRQSNQDYRGQAGNDRMNQGYDKGNAGYGNDRMNQGYDKRNDGYGNDRMNQGYDKRNDGYGNDRMNQGYDKRNDGYGNGRSFNQYDRTRRIQEPVRGSEQKTKAFGTGMVVGGLAVVLLGALLSHGH